MNLGSLIGVPIGGGGASSGGSGGAAAVYKWLFNFDGVIPDPTDPSWTLTTKLDDVGINDHTTSEPQTVSDMNAGNFVLGLCDKGASTVVTGSTGSFFMPGGDLFSWRVYSWNGSAWVAAGVADNSASTGWVDFVAAASATARYFAIVIEVTILGTDDVAFGDWRLN